MEPLVGIKFGAFQIEELLGIGGFSTVYRAKNVEQNQMVVVKFLDTALLQNKRTVDQFTREGQLASQLDHPHIIKTFGIGKLYGKPYHIMEYIPGKTIDKLLKSGDISWSNVNQLSSLIEQIALALDYVHNGGHIHRDIKPSNILITDDGIVKLLDFGLALNRVGLGLRNPNLAGTPAYMSPEQRRGEKISSKTDIYSFALVIKEMVRYYCDQVDQSFPVVQAVLQEGLAINPKHRPATANEFVEKLCLALRDSNKWIS